MADEVARLKQQIDGEIVVYASRPLVHALLEHDLADEIRLTVFPVVTGGGERFFAPMSDKRTIRRLDTRAIGDNLTYFAYEIVR